MHPVTLHGVGVITKLYFVISAAFKESMTLNHRRRHRIGIGRVGLDFVACRKPMYLTYTDVVIGE